MPTERAEGFNPDDWMSATSAGRELGVHRDTVVKRAAKGAFRIVSIDGVPYVHRDDVARAKGEQDAASQPGAAAA